MAKRAEDTPIPREAGLFAKVPPWDPPPAADRLTIEGTCEQVRAAFRLTDAEVEQLAERVIAKLYAERWAAIRRGPW